MGKIASMLLGMVMATGLLVGLSATEPLAVEAEAANYVSRLYTAPKKGQTGNHIVALQRRLRAAKVLETKYITGYFGDKTESAVKRFQRQVGLEPVNRMAYYGVWGPRGLPKEVVDKVNAAVKKTLEDPAVKKRIEDTGSLIVANTPEQFATQIAAEFDVYKKVVATQKLKLE